MKSINTSGHKFGLAPLGVGWMIWRDAEDLPEELIFDVNYLGGNMPTFALNFSRPGGQIVAQYYNLLRLGREGYRKIHQAGYDTAEYLAEQITALGPFDILYDGDPGAASPASRGGWRARSDPASPSSTSPTGSERGLAGARLLACLRTARIWRPADPRPPRLQPGPRRPADRRLPRALAHLDVHPVTSPITEAEAGSFHH